jgi:hypothetical protein
MCSQRGGTKRTNAGEEAYVGEILNWWNMYKVKKIH